MDNRNNLLDGISSDNSISYIILAQNDASQVEQVSSFLNAAFYPYENISVASDVAKNPKAAAELNLLCAKSIVKDCISVAAVDLLNADRIVGVAVNKMQEKSPSGESFFEKFTRDECNEKESISFMETMIKCDSSIDVFEMLGTPKIVELVFLGVHPEYRKRGIGRGLTKATLRVMGHLAKEKNGPKAVTSVFTSNYSQRIGESLAFELLATMSFRNFYFNGVKFSEKIGDEHKTMKVYAKKYNPKERF